MSAISLSPTRRELLAATAAAGAVEPASRNLRAAATASDAIRPFTVSFPQEEIDRTAPAHRRHALAGARVGVRRSFSVDLGDLVGRRHTRRATRHDAKAHPVLGNGIRLEQVRGAPEGAAAFRHRARRARHPFHPREIEASGCAARDHHPRLAGFGHRAAEDHRSAHQSHRARRNRGRCVRRRDPVDAGLRLFRQTDRNPVGIRRASRGRGSC